MRTLRFGSTGPAVQLLQLALDRAGFGPLETDGIFGRATANALLRFQRSHRLEADAVAGPMTHRALLPWYTGYLTHRIRPGDVYWQLARRYGTTAEAIALANPDLRPEALPVGARLVVPLGFPVVPAAIDWCADLVACCVQGLAARYPFIETGQIGSSELGRPLWRLQLGRGENRVLYNGAHHANEWITTPLLLRFAEELAAAFGGGGALFDVSAAEILDYATICLIPAVNPDGMDLVTGELQSGAAFQRARGIAAAYPRFPFPDGWKANLQGVDLNLQYPAGWEQARENKYALGVASPAPADFVGTAPLTAPESRAMYNYTFAFDPALTLSFHTQGEVIYWRYLDREPEGARQIAEAFARLSGYAVEDAPFASGFAGYKDWFILAWNRPGYTVEAGLGRNPLPVSDFDGIYEKVRGILTLGALLT